MPSRAEDHVHVVSSPSKKRRRDDDADAFRMTSLYPKLGSYPPDYHHEQGAGIYAVVGDHDRLILRAQGQDPAAPLVVPRRMLPLPVSKKIRFVETGSFTAADQQGDGKQRSRQCRSPASPGRGALNGQYNVGTWPLAGSRTTSGNTASSFHILSPCHICHRRPTKKSDLDSFAACEGCGQRTCFVCMRECLGWLPDTPLTQHEEHDNADDGDDETLSRSFHMDDVPQDGYDGNEMNHDDAMQRTGVMAQQPDGTKERWATSGHRQMVCSRCCIERGEEGDVVCLGCLSRSEAV